MCEYMHVFSFIFIVQNEMNQIAASAILIQLHIQTDVECYTFTQIKALHRLLLNLYMFKQTFNVMEFAICKLLRILTFERR